MTSPASYTSGDGDRRTRLARERTQLAWWRTGLAGFAVSIGAAKIVPALTKATKWPYSVLGVGFAVLGIAAVTYGCIRERSVETSLARGQFTDPARWLLAAMAALAVVLGLGLLVLVLATA